MPQYILHSAVNSACCERRWGGSCFISGGSVAITSCDSVVEKSNKGRRYFREQKNKNKNCRNTIKIYIKMYIYIYTFIYIKCIYIIYNYI